MKMSTVNMFVMKAMNIPEPLDVPIEITRLASF